MDEVLKWSPKNDADVCVARGTRHRVPSADTPNHRSVKERESAAGGGQLLRAREKNEKSLAPEYPHVAMIFDVFSSLDGFGSNRGNWVPPTLTSS
ncbi:hypothetical protein ACFVTE_20690 [Arthrobacter sp. NPDC058097]|uniref:hypothetical protein n=1 Tax=Arthrobacter sp. NPDC058097 TaxID=3346340 RepID=UPI0036DFA392